MFKRKLLHNGKSFLKFEIHYQKEKKEFVYFRYFVDFVCYMYNPCNKLNKKNAHKIDEKRKTLIYYSRLPARNKNKTLVYGFFVTYRIHDKKIEANKIFFTTKK